MGARARSFVAAELDEARRREQEERYEASWSSLERAHVVSQAFPMLHTRVHAAMLGFAWRRRDARELLGQLPRLLLAAPASLFGRAPRGNTGGARVSMFAPMPIPEDLERVLRE